MRVLLGQLMSSVASESTQKVSSETVAPAAPPHRVLLLAVLAFCGGLGLTIAFEQSAPAPISGYLQAKRATVVSTQSGRILEFRVKVGDVLRANQAVAVLADDDLEAELAAATREVAALTAQLEQRQAKAKVELDWRLKELESDGFEIRLKSATYLKEQFSQQIARVAWKDFVDGFDALSSIADHEDLFKSLIYQSRITADEARIRAVLQQEAANNASEVYSVQIEMCNQRLKNLASLKQQLPERIRRAVGVDVAEARLAQATAAIERLEQRKQSLTLLAPAYGTVSELRKKTGDRISAEEPIVELFDADQQFLIVEVPTQMLEDFAVDTKVYLRFPGDQHRTGRVSDVPPVATPATALPGTASQGDTVAKLRIAHSGKLWPNAPIGSAVQVSLRE